MEEEAGVQLAPFLSPFLPRVVQRRLDMAQEDLMFPIDELVMLDVPFLFLSDLACSR